MSDSAKPLRARRPRVSPHEKALALVRVDFTDTARLKDRIEDILKVFEVGGIPLDELTLQALGGVREYAQKISGVKPTSIMDLLG